MSANKAGGTGKHWINSILPAPESFYDKDASLKFVTSPAAVASYSLLLYGLSGAAFAALLGFYSHPSQFLTETVVQSSWSRPGFECAPLQNDPHYGVNYTYTECLANVVEPSATSLTLGSGANGIRTHGRIYVHPVAKRPSLRCELHVHRVFGKHSTYVNLDSDGYNWIYTPLGNSRGIKSTESTVGIRTQNDTIKNVTSQVVLDHGTEHVTQGHVYYWGPPRAGQGLTACPDWWTQSGEYACDFLQNGASPVRNMCMSYIFWLYYRPERSHRYIHVHHE